MGKDSLTMAREIINPRWGNEEKTHILAGFKYDNGQVITASITNNGDAQGNPDWEEIMNTFGAAAIDANTTKALDDHAARKQLKQEQQLQDLDRRKKEVLFNAKAEAFDIDLVKNSKNRDVKNKIRRASSVTEVLVYTAMLHMMEDPLANPVNDKMDDASTSAADPAANTAPAANT
jgi:hypothetical protein